MAIDNVHDHWLAEHWETMDSEEFRRFTVLFTDLMRRALERPYDNGRTGSEEGQGQ